MRIVFDPAKDRINQSRHGLSLSFARQLVWDEALVWVDERYAMTRYEGSDSSPKAIASTAWPSSTEAGSAGSSACATPSAVRSSTMSKATPRREIALPTEAENRKIRRAAKADPDAQPLTASQLQAMVPLKSVRGRPKSENRKLLVSVRYSPEVLSYFRATGDGWQARMDGVLRDYIAKQGTRGRKGAA